MMPRLFRVCELPRWMRSRELIWFAGGMAAAVVFTATAEIATSAATSTSTDCGAAVAAQKAVNDKVMMIGMTSVDPSKYFQVGGSSSCLGEFSLANIDFSNLIPDPMGLLSSAVSGIVDKLKNAAIGAACKVARDSMSSVITSYNSATYMLRGATNAPSYLLDSTIGQVSSKAMNDASQAWSTSGVTSGVTSVLGSVTANGASLSSLSNYSSSTSSYLSQIQNSAAGFSTAASNLESAKMNLEQANSVVASYGNSTTGVPTWATDQQKTAAAALSQAQATYNATKSQVTAPVASASSSSSTLSTGSSLF